MLRHLHCLIASGAVAALVTLTACSEDDSNPKYTSLPPEFIGVDVTPLSGDSIVRAGEPFTVTALQGKKGKLLYGATYAWGTKPDEGVSHKFRKKVVYDNDNGNPVDTIIVSNPGTYEVRLNAQYNISGNWIITSGGNEWEGGSATYSTPSILFYAVEVKQTIRVR